MLCPVCKNEVYAADKKCGKCHTDLVLHRKINAVSNRLYNDGLKKAKSGDLSGAVQSLTESVGINKKNINARNLLGLCQFKLGRVGDALREWIISHSYQRENNLADGYIAELEKNQKRLEDLSEAVSLYNTALRHMQQKSEDLAGIQLKKALDKNPYYVDALNLLALSYLVTKNRGGASTMINRALAIDAQNPIALNYYRELNPGRAVPDSRGSSVASTAERRVPSYTPSYVSSAKGGGGVTWGIFGFIAGAVITVLAAAFLIMPSMISSKDEEYNTLKSSTDTTISEQGELISQQETSISDLQSQLDTALAEVQQLQSENDTLKITEQVNAALSYLTQGDAEQAIASLEGIDTAELSTETLETYNYVKNQAYPQLEASYYQTGLTAYKAGNYDEAKTALEASVSYALTDSTTIDDAFYYLGRIAEENGDTDLAKSYYENIINNYPSSNVLSSARTRLNKLS